MRELELLEAWLDARLRGEAPEREEFLAANPELAETLRRQLDLLELAGDLPPDGSVALPRSGEAGDAHPDDAPELPLRFDGFRRTCVLGRGGMGVVIEAIQEDLGRPVAIKVLSSGVGGRLSERFAREVGTLARLRHTNIVPVFGSGSVGGRPYVVMERVDGAPLGSSIEDGCGPASADAVADLVRLVRTIAFALEHAHEQGVIHRDVKPTNILVRRDGEPLLIDFGLARDDALEALTVTGEFVGTPLYTAPEQALGRPVDRRADVYGLGATLYHLLAGRPPFPASSLTRLVHLMQTSDPPSVRRLNPSVPRDLAHVVARAIAADARDRYATARDFADDLGAVLSGRPTRARPPSIIGRTTRWVRRRPALAAAVVMSGLALSLLAMRLVEQRERQVEQRNKRLAVAEQEHRSRLANARATAWVVADAPTDEREHQALIAQSPDDPTVWFLYAVPVLHRVVLQAPRSMALADRIGAHYGFEVARLGLTPVETVAERLARAPATVRADPALTLLVELDRVRRSGESRSLREDRESLQAVIAVAIERARKGDPAGRARLANVLDRGFGLHEAAHDLLVPDVRAGSRDPDVLVGFAHLTFLLRGKRGTYEAMSAASVATEVDPGHAGLILQSRIAARGNEADREHALRLARRAVRDHPDHAGVRVHLAWTLSETHIGADWVDETEQLYLELLAKDSASSMFRQNLSNLWWDHRREERLLDVLQFKLECLPSHGSRIEHAQLIAWILNDLGHPELALRWAELSLEHMYGDADRAELRGDVVSYALDVRDAGAFLEHVRASFRHLPSGPGSLDWYVGLLLGDVSDAFDNPAWGIADDLYEACRCAQDAGRVIPAEVWARFVAEGYPHGGRPTP